MKVRIFGGNDYYGVCRWIENKILPHFNVLMLEIGLLEIEKIVEGGGRLGGKVMEGKG